MNLRMNPAHRIGTAWLALFALLLLTGGCQKAYYSTWEKLGWHKRDILVERVQKARDGQQDAKQQFQTTLQQFSALTGFKGGDLEALYNKLNASYEKSVSRAQSVSDRIDSVDSVARALFKEWEGELSQYTNPDLRRASEQELRDTQGRYDQLIAAMRRAESKMKPVLAAFKDQVLFLKHNLNARAIASLATTTQELESDVAKLIQDMEQSINEANSFIDQMKDKGEK